MGILHKLKAKFTKKRSRYFIECMDIPGCLIYTKEGSIVQASCYVIYFYDAKGKKQYYHWDVGMFYSEIDKSIFQQDNQEVFDLYSELTGSSYIKNIPMYYDREVI